MVRTLLTVAHALLIAAHALLIVAHALLTAAHTPLTMAHTILTVAHTLLTVAQALPTVAHTLLSVAHTLLTVGRALLTVAFLGIVFFCNGKLFHAKIIRYIFSRWIYGIPMNLRAKIWSRLALIYLSFISRSSGTSWTFRPFGKSLTVRCMLQRRVGRFDLNHGKYDYLYWTLDLYN